MFNRRQRNGDRRTEARGTLLQEDHRGRKATRRIGSPERRTRLEDRRSIQDRSWLGSSDRRYGIMDRRKKGRF